MFASLRLGWKANTQTVTGRVCHTECVIFRPRAAAAAALTASFGPSRPAKIPPVGSVVWKMLHIPRWRRESAIKPASSRPWFSRVQTGVSKARDRDVATEPSPERCKHSARSRRSLGGRLRFLTFHQKRRPKRGVSQTLM